MPTSELTRSSIRQGPPLVIDGGLGTELEARGIDLDHALWSADLLRDRPDIITDIHRDFLRAGAQIVTTASYQATPLGFERRGISAADGRQLIMKSVELAAEAVAAEADSAPDADLKSPSPRALVAGSVGPYGAALGDGAEYTGNYTLTTDEFTRFHRPRIDALVSAGVDLLAIETQPSLAEIEVLLALAAEYEIPAWLSVTLRDVPKRGDEPPRLADGTPLKSLAEAVSGHSFISAVGVNCVRPSLVSPALQELAHATDIPLLAYPNSGETYDAQSMRWEPDSAEHPTRDGSNFPVREWLELGARFVGGCCRTTPTDIARIAAQLID